jgi:catechol 2,3-dioxygenase-like lactoylglutathione lyase family enzyme
MASMILFAGVPVAEIASARAWYERLLGRPPDLIPNENEVAWQLAEEGWIYVVEDEARAGRSLLTLVVDDLDRELAVLTERGAPAGRVAEGVVRKLEITDPDGNKITFGQPPA